MIIDPLATLRELVEALEVQKEVYAIPTSPPASAELLKAADIGVEDALNNAHQVLDFYKRS